MEIGVVIVVLLVMVREGCQGDCLTSGIFPLHPNESKQSTKHIEQRHKCHYNHDNRHIHRKRRPEYRHNGYIRHQSVKGSEISGGYVEKKEEIISQSKLKTREIFAVEDERGGERLLRALQPIRPSWGYGNCSVETRTDSRRCVRGVERVCCERVCVDKECYCSERVL